MYLKNLNKNVTKLSGGNKKKKKNSVLVREKC